MLFDLFVSLVDGQFFTAAVHILVVVVVVLVFEGADVAFDEHDFKGHDDKGDSAKNDYDIEFVFDLVDLLFGLLIVHDTFGRVLPCGSDHDHSHQLDQKQYRHEKQKASQPIVIETKLLSH